MINLNKKYLTYKTLYLGSSYSAAYNSNNPVNEFNCLQFCIWQQNACKGHGIMIKVIDHGIMIKVIDHRACPPILGDFIKVYQIDILKKKSIIYIV